MSSPGSQCFAVKLESNLVLVVGGESRDSITTEILDITPADITSWSFAPGPTMSLERWDVFSIVPIHDSAHFLFVGGSDSFGTAMITTEVLDVNTMSFEPGPVMQTWRCLYSAAALDAHHIIVFGGADLSFESLSSSEVIVINDNIAEE